MPLIQVAPNAYYAVTAGVWFTAPASPGRGRSPTSVPAVIYTIPPSSPIYYVTYVRIYEATPQVVYVGYTPGYLGTVVVARRHRRLRHRLRLRAVDRHRSGTRRPTPTASPRRRSTTPTSASPTASRWASPPRPGRSRTGAAPTTTPATGAATAAARRPAPTSTATGATPTYSGTRTWYAGGGVAGTTASGSYANARTGTTGSYRRRPAVQRLDRQRHARLRPHGQQRRPAARATSRAPATTTSTPASARPAPRVSGTGAGRQHATTAPARRPPGPQGDAHVGGGPRPTTPRPARPTPGHAPAGRQQPLADVNGNVLRQRRQRLAAAFGRAAGAAASGDTSWADRESQARSAGGDRWGGFSGGGAGGSVAAARGGFGGGDRFGGGGFGGFGGGDRFGGGFGGSRRPLRWRRLRRRRLRRRRIPRGRPTLTPARPDRRNDARLCALRQPIR